MLRSNGTEQFPHDWAAGDIITHTSTEIVWTSPGNVLATITGGVWPTRDIGRFTQWDLLLNGNVLTGGQIGSGDPYDRTNPFDFAAGSGGASVLLNIAVSAGDEIELRLLGLFGTGDYAGINFSVEAVPVPSTLGLLAVGVLGILWSRTRTLNRKGVRRSS